MKKFFVAILLLSIISIWPFFKKGYFESHDGEWMVIRFTAFHQTLRAGQFPVRFVDRLNNNYGYPVLNFLYPLPFYLAEVPKVLGLGFVDSVKAVFATSTVFSALAMFWALSRKFSKWASFAASILYVFIPYRFVDLYVRGSFGESLAFAFIPLCLGAIFCLEDKKKTYYPVLSISIALLILSHNVMALLFLPLLFIISFILIKKSRIYLVASFLLGALISSFFIVPAIFDLQYVRLLHLKIGNPQDHLASLKSLIIPNWGYGPNPNGQNPLPVQVGIVPLFIIAGAICSQFFKKNRKLIIQVLIAIFILSIFLISNFSTFFWINFKYSDLIQFPWRLLSVVIFIASLLAAYLIDFGKDKKILAVIVITASVLSTILYIKPVRFVDKGDGYYATNESTTTVENEYLPLWATKQKTTRANTKIELENGAKIENPTIKPANYQATIKSDKSTNVLVNAIYFPGWQVKVDNRITPINYMDDYGLINFQLPAGEHKVIINYTETPVHTASDIVSLLALIIAGISFYILWQKQNS